MSQDQDFFVGYRRTMPPAHRRRALLCLLLLAAVVPAVAVLAALSHSRADAGVFEFGVAREFEGVIAEYPVPMLRVEHDGAAGGVLLVDFGKAGAPVWARESAGERVAFRGSLIHRGGIAMIEMNDPASFRVLGEADIAPPAVEELGPIVLRGEIVDTKCFLGVMRPAVGNVHRACAVRCLSGGIPAGFRARHADGSESVFILAGEPGRALELDVRLAGLPVEITGTAQMVDGMPILRAQRIRRL